MTFMSTLTVQETLRLTTQELTALLNLVAKAPCTVAEGHAISPILDKAVALVNAGLPVGSVVASKATHEGIPPEADRPVEA
jgi:hypothetical protein